jgi:carbonic anhydrase
MPASRLYTDAFTPNDALQLLKEGNFRFLNNIRQHRDLLDEVTHTKDGQKPFAVVLSCMDSRTSGELVFDQGLGDIFSIRIAGNVVTNYILGSMEYATEVAGSKLILVLGHSHCGAVKGACDHVSLGHLTSLLAGISPAVEMENTITENRNSHNDEFVQKVAELNVLNSVDQILARSEIIAARLKSGLLGIVPAMYDVSTGQVVFMEDKAIMPGGVGQLVRGESFQSAIAD